MSHAQSLVGRVLAEPEDVWAWLDARCVPLDVERVDVHASVGRVIGADVIADDPVPRVALAATDGFAVASASTVGAGEYNPLPLRITSAERLAPSTAIRVMAGDPLPGGADAVLSLEEIEWRDETLDVTTVVAVGENVIDAGREVGVAGRVVPGGRRIGPRELAMLHLAGIGQVDVVKRPRIGVVSTRVAMSNVSAWLAAAVIESWGAHLSGVEYADDDPERFGELIKAADADVVVTIGGTGVGENDFAVQCLEDVGDVVFHGIAVNPGESAAVGLAGTRLVIQAPGLPLPVLAVLELFVRRAVRRLAGLIPATECTALRVPLSQKIASRPGRLDLCRVQFEDGTAYPLAINDGTTFSTAARADGYVLVPLRSEGYDAGSTVTVHRFDDTG